MTKPTYKYKVRFIDYDCDTIDGYNHYSGGTELALLEFDGDSWIEVDCWGTEGKELVQEIIWIEDEVANEKAN